MTENRSSVAVFLLAFLAAPAPRADTTLPLPATATAPSRAPSGGGTDDEMSCDSAEWPKIRRAALAHSRGATRKIARVLRHAFRGCELAPLLEQEDEGLWAGLFTDDDSRSWRIVFLHRRSGWRVVSVEESCYED